MGAHHVALARSCAIKTLPGMTKKSLSCKRSLEGGKPHQRGRKMEGKIEHSKVLKEAPKVSME